MNSLKDRVVAFPNKLRTRGVGWLWRRIQNEIRIPSSGLGQVLRDGLSSVARMSRCNVAAKRGSTDADDTLYLFLDLDVCPLTYDFVSYLAVGELQRRKMGLASIHAVFVPGSFHGLREEPPEYDAVVGPEARRWRLHQVVVPIMRMLPAFDGYTVCATRNEAKQSLETACHICPDDYSVTFPVPPSTRLLCDVARKGEPVFPMLRASLQAMNYARQFLEPRAQGRRVVNINLRRYGFAPGRNSNDAAWIEFARSLDPERWLPVFVLDTHVAHDPLPAELEDLTICESAPWNVEIRMALYEAADLTMAVAQGPMELCWLNERCRYAMFVNPDSSPQTGEAIVTKHGFEMFKSPPYAVRGQRWVWGKDDFETIRRVFDEMTGG